MICVMYSYNAYNYILMCLKLLLVAMLFLTCPCEMLMFSLRLELDGLILSPTREKLEPTIPRKDDDSRGSQKNSPKKSSPQKTALQKRNSQKKPALRASKCHLSPKCDTVP